MENEKGTIYNQTETYDVNPKYDFIYSKEKRDLFTKEQVSHILDKIDDILALLEDPDESINSASDFICWMKRDVLDTDMD